MKRIISSTLLLFAFAFSTIAPITKEATDNYVYHQEEVSKSANELFPTVEININGNEEFESDLNFKVNGVDQNIHYTAGFFTSEKGGEEVFRMNFEKTSELFHSYYWSVTPIDTSDSEILFESQRNNGWDFSFWNRYSSQDQTDLKISIANIYEKEFSVILLTEGWKSFYSIIPVRFNIHINGDFDKTVYDDKEEYSAYTTKKSLFLKQKAIKKEKTFNQSMIKSKKSYYETEMNYYLESDFKVNDTTIHYSKRLNSEYNPGTGDSGEIIRNKLTSIYKLVDFKENFLYSLIDSDNYKLAWRQNQIMPPSIWKNFHFSNPSREYLDWNIIIRDFDDKMTSDFLADPVNQWVYNNFYSDEEFKYKISDSQENRENIDSYFSLLNNGDDEFVNETLDPIANWSMGNYDEVDNSTSSVYMINDEIENLSYEVKFIKDNVETTWYLGIPESEDILASRKWMVDYLVTNLGQIDNFKDEFMRNWHIRIVTGYKTEEFNEDLSNSTFEYDKTYSVKSVKRIEIKNKSSFLSVPEILTLTTFITSIVIVALISLLFIFKNKKENDEVLIIMGEEIIEGGEE